MATKRELGEQLLAAAENGDFAGVEEALEAGAPPNYADPIEGYTVLHHLASDDGTLECFKLCVAKGADVHIKSLAGRLPLHLAVRDGNWEVFQYLVKEKGVDPKALTDADESICHKAATLGNPAFLQFAIDQGVPFDEANEQGSTPLAIASQTGWLEGMQLLLTKGAVVQGKAPDGQTPLHTAAFWGQTDALNLLLKYGAQVNALNERGNTPLHEAAKKNKLGTVKALMAAGADPSIHNKEGQTAADLASKSLIKKQIVKDN